MYSLKKIKAIVFVALALLPVSIFFALYTGEVDLNVSTIASKLFHSDESPESIIINDIRIPEALTAFIGSGLLAISGLIMQAVFRNPLAGPSVMGVSSGASFGVVLLITLFPGIAGNHFTDHFFVIVFSSLGAIAVIVFLTIIQRRIKSIELILIAGLLISYFISSCETLLLSSADAQNVKAYIHWGFGSFSKTDYIEIALMCSMGLVLIAVSLMHGRTLDAFHINDETVYNSGINPAKSIRNLILISSIICALVTAFCGPIAFIGLCVPHITRMLLKTNRHFYLITGSFILGAHLGLICLAISRLSVFGQYIPINTITSFLGAPFIIYLLTKGYRIKNA